MQIDWDETLYVRQVAPEGFAYCKATPEQTQEAADHNAKMYALQTAANFLLHEVGQLASKCGHLVIQIHHLHDDQHSWSVHQCAACGKVLS